jgi:MFS family permease
MAKPPAAHSNGPTPLARLVAATSLSNLGDGIYQFALPLLALQTTRSPSLVSGVTVLLTIAWPLFGLHAGGIVDRFDRRAVLLGVGVVRLVTLGLLTAAIATGGLSLVVLYAVALVLGVAETLADTALTALVPAVVGPSDLERANGRITASQTVANSFVGPPLAGSLIAVGSPVAAGAATVFYGLAAVATAMLPGSGGGSAARPKSRSSLGVTAGLRFLWQNHTLRHLTLLAAAMNVWWASFYTLFVLLAVAPGPIGLTPAEFGTLMVAVSVGGIAGSLVASRIRDVMGTRNALLIDLVGTALLVGAPALTSEVALVAVANGAAGFGTGVWLVLVASIRQRLTPSALLGRVYSASRLISWGVLPASALIAGIAAELVGVRTVFAVGGLVSLALVPAFLFAIRESDLTTEDVVEDVSDDEHS